MRLSQPLRIAGFAVGGLLLLLATISLGYFPSAAESARVVPPPAVDEPAAQAAPAVAVLAGGCFWGVQGVFQHVDGVTQRRVGLCRRRAGDGAATTWSASGRTGHAEAVRITYDPRKVSYGRLLQIYFSVAHDPTQLNRQGPDVGTQYRSTIFPAIDEQARSPRPTSTSSTRPSVRRQGRDHDRARQDLLSGRGLSPGLHDAQSAPALHRHPRPAEGRRTSSACFRSLSRRAGAGRQDRHRTERQRRRRARPVAARRSSPARCRRSTRSPRPAATPDRTSPAARRSGRRRRRRRSCRPGGS